MTFFPVLDKYDCGGIIVKEEWDMEIKVVSRERIESVDITRDVQEACREWGGDGAVLVYCPHTSAGVGLDEKFDPSVVADIQKWLKNKVPHDAQYRHEEGNADAHIKCLLTGSHVMVPVVGGRLMTGRWQGVFFFEFDGPRKRSVLLSFLAGTAEAESKP